MKRSVSLGKMKIDYYYKIILNDSIFSCSTDKVGFCLETGIKEKY